MLKPPQKPKSPNFSSGPCNKPPTWDLNQINTQFLGRSHRAASPKAELQSIIERSGRLLGLPEDWVLAIVPGSDTGALEMALWQLLGIRPVDIFVWEKFSSDWAEDLAQLPLPELNQYTAPYGQLPDLQQASAEHDIVFVLNGTTSGVCIPDFDWLEQEHQGLVICDATSAVYAMPIDFEKLDVLTWSWQKTLGGEGAHGMIALSPKALAHLQVHQPSWPIPKVFRLSHRGQVPQGLFQGETINTPSMLAVADFAQCLDWAEGVGLAGLWQRVQDNYLALTQWVESTDWVSWLVSDENIRSPTSMCLVISAPDFNELDENEQKTRLHQMLHLLAEEQVAYDIKHYASAPLGFRIWGGATVESQDIQRLGPWLEWAYQTVMTES